MPAGQGPARPQTRPAATWPTDTNTVTWLASRLAMQNRAKYLGTSQQHSGTAVAVIGMRIADLLKINRCGVSKQLEA